MGFFFVVPINGESKDNIVNGFDSYRYNFDE